MRIKVLVFAIAVLGSALPVIAQQSQALPSSIFDDNWSPAHLPKAQPAQASTRSSTTAPAQIEPPAPLAAVPSPAAQQGSWKLVDELYKDDIANAKTPPQKAELARKLLAVARETQGDPVGRFVLLTQAKDLAIGSGDPATAFNCLDELAKGYQIDYLAMKLALFEALAKSVSKPDDCQTVVEGLNRWMDARIRADQFAAAKKAGEIALVAAGRSGDDALTTRTAEHIKQIGQIEAAYAAAKKALAVLDKTPDDPAANLIAGKFYCLLKGDWETGLPMLALGNDPATKALAARELAGVSGADAQMALADGWWDLADKTRGVPQDQLRQHATKWYQQALPQLTGLAKLKVEKRLASLLRPAAAQPAAKTKWLVLFKSADPSIWGMDVDNNKGYAISLTKASADIKWLKMAISDDDYIIIAMSADGLDGRGADGRFRWNGTNSFAYHGYHLGIFDTSSKCAPGDADIAYNMNRGWGFGNRCFVDDKQAYAWNGGSLGPTVFEISVNSGELSPDEAKHLLK